MIFKIEKASDCDFEDYKEINTLEELFQFTKECCKQKSIVLEVEGRPWKEEGDKDYKIPVITIYDILYRIKSWKKIKSS